jgi:RNA-binding protein YlmH
VTEVVDVRKTERPLVERASAQAKVAAVRETGEVTLFLVPRDNLEEARSHAGDRLEVRAVGTFDEALKAVAELPGSNAGSLASSAAGRQGQQP